MELCPPFDGWHIDVEGIIHTPSGYRCTPAQIESALWLRDGIVNDRARHTIFADTPQVEPRRLAETRDWIGEDLSRLQIVRNEDAALAATARTINPGQDPKKHHE